MNFEELARWYAAHGARFPWRGTRDPYRIMFTEIMLQRTRAEKVAEVYPVFFTRYPTPYSIGRARLAAIARVCAPLGLSHRIPRIRKLGRILSERGSIPRDRASLLDLPGVGEYVADTVLCYSFGRISIPVDVNIKRLFARYYGIGDIRACTITALNQYSLERRKSFDIRKLNWALLDLAKVTCTGKGPKCQECPLVIGCEYARRRKRPGSISIRESDCRN